MFRLLQIQDAGHIHSGPPWHCRVSGYVTLRSHTVRTGDAFHDARLRSSYTRSFLYIENIYLAVLGNSIMYGIIAYAEMYDLPAISIMSPQTEGMLFCTPLA